MLADLLYANEQTPATMKSNTSLLTPGERMEGFTFDMAAEQNLTASDRLNAFARRHMIAARERAEQRERNLAESRADCNAPAERIRAWEKLCGLRLPTDPEHPVLLVIAMSTRLSVDEVREQQLARRSAERSTVRSRG
jgi:hypothetical protein